MKPHYTGERMIPEVNRKDPMFAEHLSRYIFASQFIKEKTVLDIACGSGYGSFYLAKIGAKHVMGVDVSKEAISYAQARYKAKNLSFLLSDAHRLPFPKKYFDIIISYETIEHIDDQNKFVSELRRVLTDDGLLVISTPNSNIYPKGNEFHTHELTPQACNKLLSYRFKKITSLSQDSALITYILPSLRKTKDHKALKDIGVLAHIEKTSLYTLSPILPSRNQFILLLASNRPIPPFTPLLLHASSNMLDKTKGAIHDLTEQMQQLQSELLRIQKTRGWKFISFIHSLRMKIPFLKSIK